MDRLLRAGKARALRGEAKHRHCRLWAPARRKDFPKNITRAYRDFLKGCDILTASRADAVLSPDSLRLFVALWLPEALAKAALSRLALLRRDGRGVRWVRPDQLHLTLKFLGETPAAFLPEIERALAGVAAASTSFALGLEAGGVFPPSGPPRVVWIGVSPAAKLVELAARVEQALQPLGFDPETRPFRPHLTLGRAEPGAVFDRALLARPLAAQPETIAALSLVQSQLRPGGSVYRTVAEWKLG